MPLHPSPRNGFVIPRRGVPCTWPIPPCRVQLLQWCAITARHSGGSVCTLLRCPALSAAAGRLANRRPLRQPLLAVSATGGARRRCPCRVAPPFRRVEKEAKDAFRRRRHGAPAQPGRRRRRVSCPQPPSPATPLVRKGAGIQGSRVILHLSPRYEKAAQTAKTRVARQGNCRPS